MGVVVWDSKGLKDNSHGDGKAKVYINDFLAIFNNGTLDFYQTGLARFLPIIH